MRKHIKVELLQRLNLTALFWHSWMQHSTNTETGLGLNADLYVRHDLSSVSLELFSKSKGENKVSLERVNQYLNHLMSKPFFTFSLHWCFSFIKLFFATVMSLECQNSYGTIKTKKKRKKIRRNLNIKTQGPGNQYTQPKPVCWWCKWHLSPSYK